MTTPRFTLLVPVKEGAAAKSRLDVADGAARADLMAAFARDAITAALALVPERGDVLRFETGPLGMAGEAQWGGSPALASAPAGHDMASPPPALSVDRVSLFDRIVNGWTLALLAVLGFGIALLLRRRARMNDNEQGAFADLLTRQLAAEEGHRHG